MSSRAERAYRKLLDKAGALSGSELALEVVRLCLVIERLQADKACNFAPELLMPWLNNREVNQEYGIDRFCPLKLDEVAAFGAEVLTLSPAEKREVVLQLLQRTNSRDRLEYPPQIYRQLFGYELPEGCSSCAIYSVENHVALTDEILRANPGKKLRLYCATSTFLPFALFLYASADTLVSTAALDLDLDGEFPQEDLILYNGASWGTVSKGIYDAGDSPFKPHSPVALFFYRFLREGREESLLRAVAPEQLLFSDIARDLRNYLADKTSIISLSALPPGAFRPATQVRANILELKRQPVLDVPSCRLRIFIKANKADKNSAPELQEKAIPQTELLAADTWTVASFFEEKRSIFRKGAQIAKLATVVKEVFRGAPITKVETDFTDPRAQAVAHMWFERMAGLVKLIEPKSLGSITVDVESALESLVKSTRPLDRYYLENDDIVITARGRTISVSRMVNVPREAALPSSNTIVVRVDPKKADPAFIAAFLSSPMAKEEMRRRQSGSSLLLLHARNLENIGVPLPPLAEQRAIAAELSKGEREYKEKRAALDHTFFDTIRGTYERMGLETEKLQINLEQFISEEDRK